MNTRRFLNAALLPLLLTAACGEQGATPALPTLTPAPMTGTATVVGADTTTAPLTKVTLALDWVPNTNHTGFYAAQQKGFYREQGIDLQILPYSESVSTDLLVAEGRADFAIGFVEQLVVDRVNGLPVKSVAAIIQNNTSELITLKSSGLDSPAKLEGKRYAGFGAPYEEPVIGTMIRKAGGPTGQFQNITAGVGGLQALQAGQADFVWVYKGWDAIAAKRSGAEINEFPVSDFGVPDYPTPVLITGEKLLRERGELGKRFLAATSKGFDFAAANPAEAADILIAGNPPETFPDKELVRESARYLAAEYKGKAPRWGEQTLAMWTGYPKFMLETGKLEDANRQKVTSLDYAAMFSNELLP